jgi:hypothetical protein
VQQPDSANWAAAPIKGKAGTVVLKNVAAADAPATCQAAAERANAAAFCIAATARDGPPKYCFVFSQRPAKQCGPSDKKLAKPCRFAGLGAFVFQE